MNAQCEQVPPPLRGQLNRLLAASDAVARGAGDPTTLAGLGRSFVGAVRRHRHRLRRSAAAPAPAANPFGPPAELSRLVSALEGILDVLRYQVCWSFLVEARRN